MISLVVVDYNSIDKTIEYIEKVNSSIANCGVIHFVIVDNYINKSGYSILKDHFSIQEIKTVQGYEVTVFRSNCISLFYVFSNSNLGYAKGNNLGISLCNELFEDRYIIVSNNDLVFDSVLDWNDVETIFESDENICVIGPSIVGLDDKPQSPNKRVNPYSALIYNYLAFRPFKAFSDLDYDGVSRCCFRVSGCFMILKIDLFIKAGMFDPNTFMYCEEMILSERLKRIGGKVYFWNDFKLVHNHGSTVKKNTVAFTSEKWMHESYLYYFKTYRDTSSFILSISKICFKLFVIRRKLIFSLKSIKR